MLNVAVKNGYIKENPGKEVKRLTVPEKEPPYLTRNQVAALYEECDDWLYVFVAIALNTGMRRSEILALEWEDIDFHNRVIKVRSDEEFTTKGRRNRVLPVNGFLFDVLMEHPRHITNPRVVYTRSGSSLSHDSARARMIGASKRAKIPAAKPRDLRHTYGTTLAANGVNLVTIQKLMGHRDIKTTMRYLHAAPDRMKWAVENLGLDGTVEDKEGGAEKQGIDASTRA